MNWPDSRVGGRVQIKVYYEKKTFAKMQIGWQGLDQDGLARLQSGWIRVQYKKNNHLNVERVGGSRWTGQTLEWVGGSRWTGKTHEWLGGSR